MTNGVIHLPQLSKLKKEDKINELQGSFYILSKSLEWKLAPG